VLFPEREGKSCPYSAPIDPTRGNSEGSLVFSGAETGCSIISDLVEINAAPVAKPVWSSESGFFLPDRNGKKDLEFPPPTPLSGTVWEGAGLVCVPALWRSPEFCFSIPDLHGE